MLPVLALAAAIIASLPATVAATAPSAALPAPAPTLVDVTTLAPGIRLEMRYATADNFLKEAVYPCARCLLREEAAQALARVEATLEKEGLHLKVWDCYRPPSVQARMWAILPDARYVANPTRGSRHGRGGAVDITLIDANGAALEMPTAHDDFSAKVGADAPASPTAVKNRSILRAAMEAEGFTVASSEWWHFNAKGSRAWPLVDVSLCEGE